MIVEMLLPTRNQSINRVALALACVLFLSLVPNWGRQIKQLDKLQVLGAQYTKISDINIAPELAANIEQPEITAKGVLAYDLTSGSFLYTKNFDHRLPIASLTKLVTAIIVVESGKLEEVVEIQEKDTKVVGANTGLVVGERIKVKDLLYASLVSSHNDSTRALARHISVTDENFVRQMNIKARELGLSNTNFTNPIGFDNPNHYSSAHDLVKVLDEFLKNDTLSEIVRVSATEIKALNMDLTHKLTTTNKLLLEDPSVIGVKTGFTTEAKGNLVIRSVRDNADVVTIVLGSEDREGDTRKILDWVYSAYRW